MIERDYMRSVFVLGPAGAARLSLCVLVVCLASPAWTPAQSTGADGEDAVPARWVAPPVDVEQLMEEDIARRDMDVPFRVGFPMKADLAPGRFGEVETLDDGRRLWTARVHSQDALWIALGFGTFRVQPGVELTVRAPGADTVLGPFTHRDVRSHGQLWMPPVEGETVDVEVSWPSDMKSQPNLHLGTVSHGYRPWGGLGEPDDPAPDAGACNIDVNCPLGDNWQDEKRGVVNLLSGGSGYCTGSLIATTARDCQDYVLTAAHCVSGASKAASTVFQFNFERPECGSGVAPTDETVSGSALVATYGPSDMTLLEMDTTPPEEYAAYYNGWSRSTTAATESWAIHHPNNDEKKISFNEDPLIDGQNWGPDHWRVTEWEEGTTEPGSSGSPLFDQNSRIVGQLHGGTASCSSITYDEYGKVDVSWDGGGTPSSRLSDWLDPGGTGAVVEDGLDWQTCQTPQPRLDYAGHLADDGAGNGDGVVDPGETIVLEVDSRNTGTLPATNVEGALSTSLSTVTITDADAVWPDIPEDATRRSLSPHFTLDVAPEHVCGDPITLQLEMTATEDPGSWPSEFEVPTGTENVETLFFDDMEAGTESWTPQTLGGSNGWERVDTNAYSPTQSWFVADIASVSDAVLVMEPLTDLAANSELRFWHRINAENNYDGGVLEYRVDGGAWQDAGTLITRGAYNSTISTSYDSPIGGREAWSGDNGDWQEVTADLSSLAGGTVELRWRFATDSSVDDEGWWIDDVRVEATSYTCNEPGGSEVPGEASPPSGADLFTIAKDPGGYLLSWGAPESGGTVERYKLYRTVFGGPVTPECEADLGTGTSTVLATLSADRGFLVVARNGAGEGSYGTDSSGDERTPASSPCP
jgi:hypothetical protein